MDPATPSVPPLPAPGREGKDAALVQTMFDRVAPRYDLANTILSVGQDAHWRRVAAVAAQPIGSLVLDAAAGTGVLARELLEQGAAGVVAADLSHRMLTAGRGDRIVRVNADALRLPFPDGLFDAVTIGFGLRNLSDPEAGLREFARVTRPGGRLVVLEFSQPTWPPFRRLYLDYLVRVLPNIAGALSPDPGAYRYLADSILLWPDPHGLARTVASNGWEQVRFRALSGGIVAVHRARRPVA